jgi:hypothetical protein
MPTPYQTLTELFIGGAWVNATAQASTSTPRMSPGIRITRGVTDQQSRVSASTSTFTLNNRAGLWSSRNPLSPYYGLITRNVPVRHSVTPLGTYLKMQADSAKGFAYTADKAALDSTTDVDIRMELEPKTWRPLQSTVLAAKWTLSGNQRSWVIRLLADGRVTFTWSIDGLTSSLALTVSTPVPATAGRLAVRVFFDADNGAAGRTLTVQTATSINGAYTTLGTATSAGVTTIFSGSSVVGIGGGGDTIAGVLTGGIIFTGGHTYWGRVYSFQYRGAAGTLAAEANFEAQAAGVTSFADAYGNTWVLTMQARITSDNIRYTGELSELPHRWSPGGEDVFVPAVSAGLLRRLGQGAKALRSPLYRSLSTFGDGNLAGYWPLEDGGSATEGANAVPGGLPAKGPDLTFNASQADTLAGSAGGVSFNAATSHISSQTRYIAPTGNVGLLFYFQLGSLPASSVTLFRLYLDGWWDIEAGPLGYTWRKYNSAGVLEATSGVVLYVVSPVGTWIGMRLTLTQETTNIRWQTTFYAVGTTSFYTHLAGGSTYAGTLGRPSGWWVPPNAAWVDLALAHVMITQDFLDLETQLSQTAVGYTGEKAGYRFARLCDEEGVLYEIEGESAFTEAMGPQRSLPLLDLLQDCVEVDMGQMGECRDILALRYRTRVDMEANPYLTLDYTANTIAAIGEASDDDRYTANLVTVSRDDGGSATVEVLTGPLSTREPTGSPPGAGRYETTPLVNAATDAQLPGLAGWRALLGTIDQVRIPSLSIDLHRTQVSSSTALTRAVQRLDVGDGLQITNPPFWLGAEPIKLLTFGYDETINGFLWEQTHNTVPGEPYDSAMYDGGAGTVARYDTDTLYPSYLAGALTSSATTAYVSTPCELPAEALWVTTAGYPAEFPLDILTGGERMTLTAASTNPVNDSFTRVTASGWGTATSGQSWSIGGGSASDYSTDGSIGRLNLSTTVTAREVNLGVTLHPYEVLVGAMRFPAAITGGGAFGVQDVIMCKSSVGNLIRLRVFQGLAGSTNSCVLEQLSGGASVASDSEALPTTLVATTTMSVRMQVGDGFARARVWVSGAAEPLGTWNAYITLAVPALPGSVGVSAERAAASTNAAPYYADFDNVSTPRLQQFTVTRGVNGISKAHTAVPLTPVHVFDDAFYGL